MWRQRQRGANGDNSDQDDNEGEDDDYVDDDGGDFDKDGNKNDDERDDNYDDDTDLNEVDAQDDANADSYSNDGKCCDNIADFLVCDNDNTDEDESTLNCLCKTDNSTDAKYAGIDVPYANNDGDAEDARDAGRTFNHDDYVIIRG